MAEESRESSASDGTVRTPQGWAVDSWRARLDEHPMTRGYASPYADAEATRVVEARLRSLPPLVTSFEIERLRSLLVEAQEGRRFVLWGGDCAETFDDCTSPVIAGKIKIILQMSFALMHAGGTAVLRIGRMAGQYAKPRSSPTETRDGRTLPSYFGDLINRAEFSADARTPDPGLMLEGYTHAAMTINFVRALLHAGFGDIRHPEYWELGSLQHAGLTPSVRAQYQRLLNSVRQTLRARDAEQPEQDAPPGSVEFFTSHEALNLHYESAQTRCVPRRVGHYNLSTHLPWLGDRTRDLSGPHVEYLRGIRNPVGVKIGPACAPEQLGELLALLNPDREPGRVVLMPRLGARLVRERLPRLIDAARAASVPSLWVCDPMHGNTTLTPSGRKTRSFDDIAAEIDASFDIHRAKGTVMGGVHIELTGEDVTECVGGAMGLTTADLERRYDSPCDPRLNYEQSLELAFRVAERLRHLAANEIHEPKPASTGSLTPPTIA